MTDFKIPRKKFPYDDNFTSDIPLLEPPAPSSTYAQNKVIHFAFQLGEFLT